MLIEHSVGYFSLSNESYYHVISCRIYMIVPTHHACSGAVVEALHYKPEGRGIDSRWCHWNFSLE
jgi:hypothetical protein